MQKNLRDKIFYPLNNRLLRFLEYKPQSESKFKKNIKNGLYNFLYNDQDGQTIAWLMGLQKLENYLSEEKISKYKKFGGKSKNKKISGKKLKGGLLQYISLSHVKHPKTEADKTPSDMFIENIYAMKENIHKYIRYKNYSLEITSKQNALIIALHNASRTKEYMHIACFKSNNKQKSYAHVTLIEECGINKKIRYYYNNDSVNSLKDLIDICNEIRYYVFILGTEELIPECISRAMSHDWKNYWNDIFKIFIDGLKFIYTGVGKFPKTFSSRASRNQLAISTENRYISPKKPLMKKTQNSQV